MEIEDCPNLLPNSWQKTLTFFFLDYLGDAQFRQAAAKSQPPWTVLLLESRNWRVTFFDLSTAKQPGHLACCQFNAQETLSRSEIYIRHSYTVMYNGCWTRWGTCFIFPFKSLSLQYWKRPQISIKLSNLYRTADVVVIVKALWCLLYTTKGTLVNFRDISSERSQSQKILMYLGSECEQINLEGWLVFIGWLL